MLFIIISLFNIRDRNHLMKSWSTFLRSLFSIVFLIRIIIIILNWVSVFYLSSCLINLHVIAKSHYLTNVISDQLNLKIFIFIINDMIIKSFAFFYHSLRTNIWKSVETLKYFLWLSIYWDDTNSVSNEINLTIWF